MINHLVVNPDLYDLTFMTDDNMKFEMIKANIKSVPKSKMKTSFINGKGTLIVDKEFYEQTIDEGMSFLKQNNLGDDVYWVNKNGLVLPCGFYQVAVASGLESKNTDIRYNVIDFFEKMVEETGIYLSSKYDYLLKTYSISLKGYDYEHLVLKFNEFILENGIYPFEKIEVTSRYGKLEQREYPILTKRK